MARAELAWIVVLLVAAAAGCTVCASPYDDCGPVPPGNGAEVYYSTARAGSVLSMDGMSVLSAERMPVGEGEVGDAEPIPAGTPVELDDWRASRRAPSQP